MGKGFSETVNSVGKKTGQFFGDVGTKVSHMPRTYSRSMENVIENPASGKAWGDFGLSTFTYGYAGAGDTEKTLAGKDGRKVQAAAEMPVIPQGDVPIDPNLKNDQDAARRRGRASTILAGNSSLEEENTDEKKSAKKTLLGA